MKERRHMNRRRRMVRNLYSYLNRRVRKRKGRRMHEKLYDEVEDWFDEEESPSSVDEDMEED